MCVKFLYSFLCAYITLRKIELRGSNLDPCVAEEQGYLAVYFARLGSLDVIVFFAGSWQAFVSNRTEHGFRAFFDRQPPTLTAWVDRVLAVLHQNNRPVAQKMRTGLLYLKLLVL